MEGIKDEMGDGMQCIDHPHRNNPGGICAFCLQEKLGKLVSSSFPLPITAAISSPSSSSPSFRSHTAPPPPPPPTSSLPLPVPPISDKKNTNDHDPFMRSRLPFLLPKKKKKKPSKNPSSSPSASTTTSDVVFKRSKSTATPRRGQFLDDEDNFSPRKRNGFWSFLYLSSTQSSASSNKILEAKSFRDSNGSPRISTVKPRDKSSLGRKSDMVVVEEDVSPNSQASASSSSLERKVSRSRSVGCGSRSFSGDFFERISTGLGDCTLRRVESQREGNPKVGGGGHGATMMNNHHCMKERVRCGGIFGGFMMMTSSSSSSSSSSYWVSSSADDGELSHGKGKSWGWALASPMRAFSSKASSKDNKRDANSEKNTTPNLSAVPSLLTVRG